MTQPWYPFYWSDYSGKTLHLTRSQHGAYFLFLRYIYTTGKPIPHEQRYNICRADDEPGMSDADAMLKEFFQQRLDNWHHKRAEEIIKESDVRKEKFVSAGKQRWKTKIASHKPASSHALATTTTTTTTKKEVSISSRFLLESIPANWIEFCNEKRPDLNPQEIFDGFKDYWTSIPGMKGKKSDWDATWRNWIRNQKGKINAANNTNKPTWKSEGKRLAEKYAAEAEREEQAAISNADGANMCIAETIR